MGQMCKSLEWTHCLQICSPLGSAGSWLEKKEERRKIRCREALDGSWKGKEWSKAGGGGAGGREGTFCSLAPVGRTGEIQSFAHVPSDVYARLRASRPAGGCGSEGRGEHLAEAGEKTASPGVRWMESTAEIQKI